MSTKSVLIIAMVAWVGSGCEQSISPPPKESGSPPREAPTQAPQQGDVVSSEGPHVVELAGGLDATYAIMDDGSVRGWGRVPELEPPHKALGSPRHSVATPVEVAGLRDVVHIATALLSPQTCAITRDRDAACWNGVKAPRAGSTPFELPDGGPPTLIPELKGAQDIELLTSGACILRAGQVLCWGSNMSGLFANGKKDFSERHETLVPIDGLTDVTMLASGSNHVCALRANGTVACWGANFVGNAAPTPERDVLTPFTLQELSGVRFITANERISCALKDDATLWCWGDGLEGVEKLAEKVSRVRSRDARTCLIAEGKLSCLGERDHLGELGSGAPQGNRGKKRSVRDLLPLSGLSGVTALGLGRYHTCAVHASGTSCWGDNTRGQLGDGTLIDRLEPTPVKHLGREQLPPPERGYGEAQQDPPQTWPETLPEGCEANTALRLEDPRLSITQLPLRSAFAEKERAGLSVIMGDYHFGRPQRHVYDLPHPRGTQMLLKLEVSLARVGQFPMKREAEDAPGLERLTLRSDEIEVPVNVFLEGESAHVEITYLGDDFVCGQIEVATRDTRLSGHFSAAVFQAD